MRGRGPGVAGAPAAGRGRPGDVRQPDSHAPAARRQPVAPGAGAARDGSRPTPGKKTAAGPIFHELAERLTKRGVVIVLSDFFDDVDSLVAGLKHFRHRRHDVVLLHVLDPAELDFTLAGRRSSRGWKNFPEVKADPSVIRRAYLKEFAAFQQSTRVDEVPAAPRIAPRRRRQRPLRAAAACSQLPPRPVRSVALLLPRFVNGPSASRMPLSSAVCVSRAPIIALNARGVLMRMDAWFVRRRGWVAGASDA